MPAQHLTTGQKGEDLAAAWLKEKGMRIVVRNFRCSGGEIDLICQDQSTLVFVEVKTRSTAAYGVPGQAVDRSKARKMVRAAMTYLTQHKAWHRACRFDFVGIVLLNQEFTVEHWEDVIDVRKALGRSNTSWQPW
ncbi:MAG: YraN family protein [Desulfomicrobium sp.]|jgi:putative endonuclease|nr:YraN family protein [Desulfomicrobium sp.]NLV96038.1 YraN family protein [Desulfovibrionales bacterium]